MVECTACYRGHEPAIAIGQQATSSQRIKEKAKARHKIRNHHMVRDFSLAGLVCIRGDMGRMDLFSLFKIKTRLAGRSRHGSILSGCAIRRFGRPIRLWSRRMGSRRLRTIQKSLYNIARMDDHGSSTLADREQAEIKTRRPNCGRQEGKKGKTQSKQK